MNYETARAKAQIVFDMLAPHCIRIEIAGAICRRKQDDIKDIEICCIPKPYDLDMFESGIATVINRWDKVRGNLQYSGAKRCKHTQRLLPDGTQVDIFFADEINWGYIFAIRTGSADYSHKVLATKWVMLGYKGVDGYLTYNNKIVAVPEEKNLFDLLKIPYGAPELRCY